MTREKSIQFRVLRATCGQLPVVLGAGRACDLFAVSFADILDDVRESGYQRPFDARHSREFREYVEKPGATTIPLTFNLRGSPGDGWTLAGGAPDRPATLSVRVPTADLPAVMAQVDCQHRLGTMTDSPVSLTFQCYLGLTPLEEMAIFNVINGKAKGLSSSLLDYHETKLVPGLETVHLDLYIAKTLNDDPASVWHGKVKLGGAGTQGSQRRVSLRGLQTATKYLLKQCLLGSAPVLTPVEKYQVVRAFWSAVAQVWRDAWDEPRRHLLTKGVGVEALSLLAGDIITAMLSRKQQPAVQTFVEYLAPLAALDWSNAGMFRAYGGRQGAREAYQMLASRVFAPGLALVRTGT